MSEFSAAIGTDLQSVADLLRQLAVGQGAPGRGADRQGSGDRLRHLVCGASTAPAQ
jgi:hypothetical protein